MPQPKPNPTGTTLIRLADIPLNVRKQAALTLMRYSVDSHEYARLFELVWDPGSAGGRVAA